MRVLITGASGLLGKALIENNEQQHEVIATYIGNYTMRDQGSVQYFKIDIRDKNGYENLFRKYKPQVTIHTAGIGSPDFAEQNKELVSDVNLGGTKNIAEKCELFNSKLIFISSNGVYDGRQAPYGEDDRAEPLNYYGVIKLMGEEVVKETRIPHAIVRPILMYGWNYSVERTNIVTQSILKLQQGEKVYAYDDVYVNPLFNNNCAEVIWKMINDDTIQDYNIGGADRVSIYQLIDKVAEIFDLKRSLVFSVRQGYFNELVARPQDTTLKTEKMEKELGILPLTLDEGLALMRDALK